MLTIPEHSDCINIPATGPGFLFSLYSSTINMAVNIAEENSFLKGPRDIKGIFPIRKSPARLLL